VVIAVAASAAASAQEQKAADAQNKYQAKQYALANRASLEQYASLRDREQQERAKGAQDLAQVTAQARMATASAALQGIESGTAGHSVEALLRQFESVELGNQQVALANAAAISRQTRAEERGIYQDLVASRPNPVLGPLNSNLGILGAGLNAASAGFGAYTATKGPSGPGLGANPQTPRPVSIPPSFVQGAF